MVKTKSKKLILHSRNHPYDYALMLQRLKVPYKVSKTSSSCSIEHQDRKVMFSAGDIKKPEMILQQRFFHQIIQNYQ